MNQHDALDLAQDVMVKIVAHQGIDVSEDGTFNPLAYVNKVARNTWIDSFRRKQRRPDCLDDSSDEIVAIPGHDSDEDWVARQELESMLSDVRPDYREPLIMHAWGLEYSEIATILGVPMGTVRSRISRGREEAQRLLDKQG